MTGKLGKLLGRSMRLATALLVAPSLALGQSDISCFDGTVPVNQDLSENPVTQPEGLGSFQLPDLGSAGLTVDYARREL